MFNSLRSRRKGFLVLTTMAALLTALVGYLLMHWLQTESVQSIHYSIDSWRTILTAIRCTAIALLALSWNHLLAWCCKAGMFTRSQAPYLTGLRWRIITWLMLLELVLGQGVLVKAMGLVVGAVP